MRRCTWGRGSGRITCSSRAVEVLVDCSGDPEEELCEEHSRARQAEWKARCRAADAAFVHYEQRKAF